MNQQNKSDFENFWHWLMNECRDFLRLGEQLKPENLVEANNSSECHQRPTSQLPPLDRFRICPHDKLGYGEITTGRGNPIIFSKSMAEATWHRYHGMRQATHRLMVAHGITPSAPLPHQMPSSYEKPGRKVYPQNWVDCPKLFQAPAYVAAAIYCYCKSFPDLELYMP